MPPFAGLYRHPIGPAMNLGVHIQTVFGAVAAVRQQQQPVGQGQCRRLIGRDFHADVAQSVDRHHERMSDCRAATELCNRNGLVAFDTKSDRPAEQEPGVVGKEQRAAAHEEHEAEPAAASPSVEGVGDDSFGQDQESTSTDVKPFQPTVCRHRRDQCCRGL